MLYGLLLPPLVWAIQLYLNFGLASHACFPGEAPRAELSCKVGNEHGACCSSSISSARRSARSAFSRPAILGIVCATNTPVKEKSAGVAYPSQERLRSFAVAGAMMSAVFTAAILFDTIYLWALSTCSQA